MSYSFYWFVKCNQFSSFQFNLDRNKIDHKQDDKVTASNVGVSFSVETFHAQV